MQLIVLGMHRSGTSLLARLLNLMGAYFGGEGSSTGANDENPKGFWERRDVRSLNDFALHSVGCDWDRVAQFAVADVPDEVVSEFTKRAHNVVMELDAHRPWVIKEPRISLLLPLWLRVLEAPICVRVLRHPVEVASSLQKRNGIPMEVGLALWEKYVMLAAMASESVPRVTLSHRQLVLEPVDSVRKLASQLKAEGVTGLRNPAEREIVAFVARDLYRERESRPDLLRYSKASQVALFERLLQGEILRGGNTEENSNQVLRKYEASLPAVDANPKRDLVSFSNSSVQERIMDLNKAAASAQRSLKELGLELRQVKQSTEIANNRQQQRDEQMAQMCSEMVGIAKQFEQGIQEARARERALTLDLEETRRQAERSAQDLSRAQQKIATLSSDLDLSKSANATAEQRISDRFRETGELTRMLMEQTRGANRLVLEADRLRKELQAAKAAQSGAENSAKAAKQQAISKALQVRSMAATLKECQQELEHQKKLLNQVTSSIAWKMTVPVRVLTRTRRKKAARRENDETARAIRDSGLFDAEWYASRYPDVGRAGADPVEHYLRHGAKEGRDPSPNFSTFSYLKSYPDVAQSGMNPLLHFIRHGRTEGRSATRK